MGALGSMMAVVHAWVAAGAAIVAGAVLVLAMLDATGVVATRRWQDRLAVALVALLAVAALLGPGIVIGLRPPSDPMHSVYAVAAIGAVPAGRLLAVRRSSGRVSWWVAGGALVTLLALLRLWNTGADNRPTGASTRGGAPAMTVLRCRCNAAAMSSWFPRCGRSPRLLGITSNVPPWTCL